MSDSDRLSLSDYVGILRARRWTLLLVFVLCLGGAIAYSLSQSPIYRSSARVLVDQDTAAEIFDPVTGTRGDRQMKNEAEFAESDQVQEIADAILIDLGVVVTPGLKSGDVVNINVSDNADADVLTFVATSRRAPEAQLIAQTYAETYIEARRETQLNEYLTSATVLQGRVDEIDRELEASPSEGEALRLEAELATITAALRDLRLTADLTDGESARIITQASLANNPFSPRTSRNIFLGAFMGILLGVGAALLRDGLDRSIGTKERLEAATPGVPNLVVVPSIRGWRNRATTQIISREQPQSPAAESYRTLRAAIDFSALLEDIRVLQLTSAKPGEGKSTTAVNLAMVMAQAGRKVLLVDCDFRKPRIHEFLAHDLEPGLSSVMIRDLTLEEAIHEAPVQADEMDNTDALPAILTAGPRPPGPSELLGSEHADVIFEDIRKMADLIIVDCPPVLAVSDALILSRHVDATLLVVNGQRTEAAEVENAFSALRQVEARIVGTVLNQPRSNSGKVYGYQYSYGAAPEPRKRKGALGE